jgi:hypothetical protein
MIIKSKSYTNNLHKKKYCIKLIHKLENLLIFMETEWIFETCRNKYVSQLHFGSSVTGGWMYVIIGSHFVPLEGKFLLIALVIVRITLNVTVRQMPLNAKQRCVHRSKNCCQSFEHFDNVFAEEKITLSKCLRVILTITNAISKNLPSSVTKWLPIMTYIHPPV